MCRKFLPGRPWVTIHRTWRVNAGVFPRRGGARCRDSWRNATSRDCVVGLIEMLILAFERTPGMSTRHYPRRRAASGSVTRRASLVVPLITLVTLSGCRSVGSATVKQSILANQFPAVGATKEQVKAQLGSPYPLSTGYEVLVRMRPGARPVIPPELEALAERGNTWGHFYFSERPGDPFSSVARCPPPLLSIILSGMAALLFSDYFVDERWIICTKFGDDARVTQVGALHKSCVGCFMGNCGSRNTYAAEGSAQLSDENPYCR